MWIDEQIVHRKPCTIEKDDCINDEADKAVRFHGADQPYEGEDEHEVIGKEAKQLSEGVVPVGTEHAVEKVEGVAEEDKEDLKKGLQDLSRGRSVNGLHHLTMLVHVPVNLPGSVENRKQTIVDLDAAVGHLKKAFVGTYLKTGLSKMFTIAADSVLIINPTAPFSTLLKELNLIPVITIPCSNSFGTFFTSFS